MSKEDRGDEVVETKDEVEGEEKAEKEEVVETKGEEKKDEPKVEKDDAEDEEKGDKRVRIPKHRLDEVVAKSKAEREAYQKRIADLEAAQAEAAKGKDEANPVDELRAALDKLEDEYETHLTAGEKEKAAAVRRQRRELETHISALERDDLIKAQDKRLADARVQLMSEMTYSQAVTAMEGLYPQLAYGTEGYDEGLANDIAIYRDGQIARGVDPATALQAALVTFRPVLKAAEGGTKGADTKAERERQAREKAAAALGKQPPRLDKAGLDSDKAGGAKGKDIMAMTSDEFEKLSEDQKAVMRGDVL